MKKFLALFLALPLYGADRTIEQLGGVTTLYPSDFLLITTSNGVPNANWTNYVTTFSNLCWHTRLIVGGVITNNISTISNAVTANVTNLLTATITTNYLDSNGDAISFTSAGSFANSTQAKSIFVYFGGNILFQSTNILFTTGVTNFWRLQGEIVRYGAASYVSSVSLIPSSLHSYSAGGTTNYASTMTITGVESLATNNTLAIRTRGISAGDVTNHYLSVLNLPQH